MKYFPILLVLCLSACRYADPVELAADSIDPRAVSFSGGKLQECSPEQFELSFTTCGMGANFCSLQPAFEVKGYDYLYTMEQSSGWKGTEWKKPEFVCEGTIRTSSIDSIISLIRPLPDTVWKWDPGISSGVIQYMSVRAGGKKVWLTLHNAYDVTAAKILAILNSNLPADEHPLWIMDDRYMSSMAEQHVSYE